MSKKVIVIKVHRNAAGHTVPYDKLYFFDRDSRDLIPEIFGYALVLPVDDQLTQSLNGLTPKTVSHYKQYRDDSTLNTTTHIDGVPLDGRKHTANSRKTWWREHVLDKYDLENRVAVVPILTRKTRSRRRPKYLTAKNWYAQRPPSKRAQPPQTPISEFAYLATPNPPPNDKIRPLCTICPRSLLHLQGKCTPGQPICYHTLDFNKIDVTGLVSEQNDRKTT